MRNRVDGGERSEEEEEEEAEQEEHCAEQVPSEAPKRNKWIVKQVCGDFPTVIVWTHSAALGFGNRAVSHYLYKRPVSSKILSLHRPAEN